MESILENVFCLCYGIVSFINTIHDVKLVNDSFYYEYDKIYFNCMFLMVEC